MCALGVDNVVLVSACWCCVLNPPRLFIVRMAFIWSENRAACRACRYRYSKCCSFRQSQFKKANKITGCQLTWAVCHVLDFNRKFGCIWNGTKYCDVTRSWRNYVSKYFLLIKSQRNKPNWCECGSSLQHRHEWANAHCQVQIFPFVRKVQLCQQWRKCFWEMSREKLLFRVTMEKFFASSNWMS